MSERIILGSTSPRRSYLLGLLGIDFETIAPEIDEAPRPDEAPLDYLSRMSESKWRAVANGIANQALLICADTIVIGPDGELMQKPLSSEEATSTLEKIRAKTVQIATSVAIGQTLGPEPKVITSASSVKIADFRDDDMRNYVESGLPLDRAGGFGIQDKDYPIVESFSDCYSNILGLPICVLNNLINQPNSPPPEELCPILCSPLKDQDL